MQRGCILASPWYILDKPLRSDDPSPVDALKAQIGRPESREDCVRKSLRARLKNSCSHLSDEDFELLVTRMTHEQLRSEGVHWRNDDC